MNFARILLTELLTLIQICKPQNVNKKAKWLNLKIITGLNL